MIEKLTRFITANRNALIFSGVAAGVTAVAFKYMFAAPPLVTTASSPEEGLKHAKALSIRTGIWECVSIIYSAQDDQAMQEAGLQFLSYLEAVEKSSGEFEKVVKQAIEALRQTGNQRLQTAYTLLTNALAQQSQGKEVAVQANKAKLSQLARQFTHKKIPADGNCLFASIAHQLSLDPASLRKQVASFLKRTNDIGLKFGVMNEIENAIEARKGGHLVPGWPADLIDSFASKNEEKKIEAYLNRLETSASLFGGNVEIAAICKSFNVQIEIYSADLKKPIVFGTSRQVIHLFYHGEKVAHYDLLIPKK